MHEFLELNSVILALTGGGVGAAVYRLWSSIKHQITKDQVSRERRLYTLESNDGLQQAGIVAMLHHEIYIICNLHLAAGYISVDDLDDLGYLYKSYRSLGGNGTGEKLYKKVCDLPIKNVGR